MKAITKAEAESLADKLLEKINGISNNSDVNIVIENGASLTKASLVKTILANENIYIPFQRSIQFDNLQDETVKSICSPEGSITMTETFNKGYSAEELLNIDLSSLDVHCEGVNSNRAVAYGVPTALDSNIVPSSSKYYAVTYTGKSIDGNEFSANAVYNAIDPTKKEYYITKAEPKSSPRSTTKKSNVVTSIGNQIKSNGMNTSKSIKIGAEKYSWNHYEGVINNSSNDGELYSWEDSITENSGRIITNATCIYNNANYEGIPTQFLVNDFSTGSTYKEENGIVKLANGSLSIVCKYGKSGIVTLEKPSYVKPESANIVSTNLSRIDSDCIGLVSVSTNSITGTEEVVITPNFASLKSKSDVSKIVDALKKWNIGSSSNVSSVQGNNIWINVASGNNSFAEDGTYTINNYVSLTDYLKKK